jgi:hypothetical protein
MKRALLAIWDFLAGAATAALVSVGVAAWWLIPLAVAVLLTRSLARHRGS